MSSEYQDRVERLIFSANEEINKLIVSEEDIKELLDFRKQFYRYSLRNMQLIKKQFTGAEVVGSFDFWKEKGFHVKRGEKGIEMLVPIKVQMFRTEDGKTKSVKYANKEEKEKISRGDIQVYPMTRFKIGHVFDISQTNATTDDLPKLFPNRWLDGDVPNYQSFYQGLEQVAKSIDSNIIKTGRELGVSKGVTYTTTGDIELNHRNGELQNIKTLIHELAHAKLHSKENKGRYSRNEEEFQAELVAYAVCSYFNLDVSEYSLRYLKNWTKGTDIPNRINLLEEVCTTTKEFIKILEDSGELERELNQISINDKEREPIAREEVPVESEKVDREHKTINEKIPDINFRKFILENILNRKDGTTDIFESDLEELSKIKEVNMEKHRHIENIQGIEWFKSLEKLDVSFNRIKALDVSELLNLKELYAYQCGLDTIKLPSVSKLETLDVTLNNLSFLDLEQQKMLESLSCSNNDLIELDVRNCSLLKELYCNFNYLAELDLSENKELNTLYCESYKKLNSVTAYDYKNLIDGDVYNEVLNVNFIDSEGIKLKECGRVMRYFAERAIHAEGEMVYVDEEEFREFIEDYNITQKDWNQFNKDIEDFDLGIYIEHISDDISPYINGEQVTIPYAWDGQCVIMYENFYKHFNHNDWTINGRFPDRNFRKEILSQVLERNDGTTDIFESDLEIIKNERVLLIANSKISDLTGIDNFTSLQHLDVAFNPITELKGLSESISKIYAHNTKLTELKNDDIPKEIEILDVSFSKLKSLDVTGCEDLRFLFCGDNELKELNLKDCHSLETLMCEKNLLKNLEIDTLPMLEQLDCSNNLLSHLEVNDGLTWLACNENHLKELNLNHCEDLAHLDCESNNLSRLEISNLKELSHINCNKNDLTSHQLIKGLSKIQADEFEKER